MSLNLIDLIKGQLGPALVSQAASQFGESESSISKAIGGLLPAIVGGLANNSSSPAVLDAVTSPASHGLLSNLMGNTTSNPLVGNIVSSLFGDKVGTIVNAVSSFAGVSNTTSNSLLGTVAAAALGTIGKFSADNNLDKSGVTKLLSDQKGVVSTLLPAGLSLATLGLGSFGSATENVKVSTPETPKFEAPKVDVNRGGNTHVDVEKKGGSLLKWLLPLLLLLLAGWFLWKQCNKPKADAVTSTGDSTNIVSDSAATNVGDNVATMGDRTLQDIDLNGTNIKGYSNGLEMSLVNFLKSDGYKNAADDEVLKSKWYSFDNVNFVFGKSDQLTAESKGQLQNLAAILKAYPDAKIKIGAYTDKKGDEAVNKALSQKRADFIKAELTKLGVGDKVLAAEGYGEEFATVAESASDKERAADRKMAVRFAK